MKLEKVHIWSFEKEGNQIKYYLLKRFSLLAQLEVLHLKTKQYTQY